MDFYWRPPHERPSGCNEPDKTPHQTSGRRESRIKHNTPRIGSYLAFKRQGRHLAHTHTHIVYAHFIAFVRSFDNIDNASSLNNKKMASGF